MTTPAASANGNEIETPRNIHDNAAVTMMPNALLNTLAMLLKCLTTTLVTSPNAASVITTAHAPNPNPRSAFPSLILSPSRTIAKRKLPTTPNAYSCAFCRCMLTWYSPLYVCSVAIPANAARMEHRRTIANAPIGYASAPPQVSTSPLLEWHSAISLLITPSSRKKMASHCVLEIGRFRSHQDMIATTGISTCAKTTQVIGDVKRFITMNRM